MASLACDRGGKKRILFFDHDGKRRTLRLGKISKKQAEIVKTHVEHLVSSRVTRTAPPLETSHWLAGLGSDLSGKLAQWGLADRRDAVGLRAFISEYVAGRTDLKPRTVVKFNATADYLCNHFGDEADLRAITAGGADQFRVMLVSKRLSENTVRKHIGISKQFFNAAMRRRLIESNPFSDLKSTIQANPDRFHFVTREEAEAVLDACPDAQWRLIFSLARFGGLRCPSEILALTWDCIDWDRKTILVRAPKTEHHVGKAARLIPMFPELRSILEQVYDEAPEGTEHVISRYRAGQQNLRTQFNRIVLRAGLKPWGKPFQNCRSTRQTELAETFPQHAVCEWMGNSKPVADRHYLQVTEEHFARAIGDGVAQNAAQSAAATACQELPSNQGHNAQCPSTVASDESWRLLAGSKDSPGGTRTPDQGIMSPL